MSQYSPLFKPWLNAVGADAALAAVADWLDSAAVYALDGEGRVLFWSRSAERLLGFSSDRVLGQPGAAILPCPASEDLAERGQLDHQPAAVTRADGTPLRVRRSARGFFDARGKFLGSIGVLWPEPPDSAEPSAQVEDFHGLLTCDPAMKQAFQIVRNVAETDATVLIRGESGTGKELIARALHEESQRRQRPFLAINCAALSPSLLESELFGHVRGAFTGALKDHAGLFKRADGGTLFLDEVAELPPELQAKLLRVLQDKTFLPVGGDRPVAVDVRIVAATHRSLREETKAGRFREDLMYRLRVVPIFLPPLRARREDIKLLLGHFIERHNAQGPRRILSVAPDALRVLLDYPWPGNIRELQNVVEYAFAVGRGEVLKLEDLPPEFREQPPAPAGSPPSEPLSEAARIRAALAQSGGKVEQAARLLGISRATLWRKRKRHGL
ncbi:sigma-54 interaction domain-containing protein [Candidatus Methylocalor cossyra]|uniref:PAS domain S-box-containing protein n=1 Tax=Candidatus Methylocalor cossyra TaxID=3108543 RepID=A0ABP1C6Z9_9GAMM